MTAAFILTITSDSKVRLVGKRRQQIQIPAWRGLFHFGEKTPLKNFPLLIVG